MKYLPCWTIGAGALLALTAAPSVSAGVIMAESSVAKGPDGVLSSQDKTVYVQGNKQKIDRGRVAEITDLDKGIIYIINKHDRVYAELPLETFHSSQPDSFQESQDSVTLKKTGGKKVIANHSCNEYRTAEGNKLERVTISACVSENAPGAKELSQFAHNMVARLRGRSFGDSAEPDTAVMLYKQSVLSFRVPDLSRAKTFRTASLMAETRVNKIEVQKLSNDTFEPPGGYSKLHQPRRRMSPEKPPDSDQALQAMYSEPPVRSRLAT